MPIDLTQYRLLQHIDSPSDLRKLEPSELKDLAQEVRNYLYESLNISGGHFAASLGTVELTIALHYALATPQDNLIWDVGHQAYVHKILTERRDALPTIRKHQGLAAFPSREESQYDAFGVGHSSTSISAALGMSLAAQKLGLEQRNIAIIGDGAMTAGMAFEAMNHAGDTRAKLLVILNDNDMSISENAGGLNNYLARILSGKVYTGMREGGKKILEKIPSMWELAKRTEEHVKGMVIPGTLFEELGFNYIGPIDGHNIPLLLETLNNLKDQDGPRLLHVITQKGKGFAPAEQDPIGYHAVKPGFYDQYKSEQPAKPASQKQKTYSEVFGDWLCDMAEKDDKLIAITPAMREGSGLVNYSKRFPERYIDVCIAEQHSVTLAAGLACNGIKPVVAIYSTFLQRAYDQLIHDVLLQNLDVLFAIDRAGLVGGDGPTHAGSFDLSYLRCLPNIIVMAASDENECRQMLYTGYLHQGPAAVRYPRGTGPNIAIEQEMQAIEIGKAELRREGEHIAILAFGSMLTPSLIAGEKLNATVVNMRFVKPLDEELILSIAKSHDVIVTAEENTILGGAGSAVSEVLQANKFTNVILTLGLPDTFLGHGNPSDMLSDLGLDAQGIVEQIENFIGDNPKIC